MDENILDYFKFNKKFTRYYQSHNIVWCNGIQEPFIFESESEAIKMLEHLRRLEVIQLNLHTLALFCCKRKVSKEEYIYYLGKIYSDEFF